MFLMRLSLLLLCLLGAAPARAEPLPQTQAAARALLEQAWQTDLPRLQQLTRPDAVRGNPYNLYNAQIQTANLLTHADRHKDPVWIARLVALYEPAFEALVETDQLAIFYPAAGWLSLRTARRGVFESPVPVRMWLPETLDQEEIGMESMLVSSQFLYGVARLTRLIGELEDPAPALQAFARRAAQIAGVDHYLRWIEGLPDVPGAFQRRGWGCSEGNFTHQAHVENLLHRHYGTRALGRPYSDLSYCNAVTDTNLFIIAGAAEIAAAAVNAQDGLGLTPAQIESLRTHAAKGAMLIENRHAVGFHPEGLVAVFDPGAFQDHPDLAYAGYVQTDGLACLSCPKCTAQCTAFPGWFEKGQKARIAPPAAVEGVGWDISHARRLVLVYDSLARHRDLLDVPFPTERHITQLARQFVLWVWNGDLHNPVFATYFDGTTGWYRVNYNDQPGSGYAPGSFSKWAMTMGYGFWRDYDPRMGQAIDAAARRYQADRDPRKPEGARQLLQMLPEIAPLAQTGRGF